MGDGSVDRMVGRPLDLAGPGMGSGWSWVKEYNPLECLDKYD